MSDSRIAGFHESLNHTPAELRQTVEADDTGIRIAAEDVESDVGALAAPAGAQDDLAGRQEDVSAAGAGEEAHLRIRLSDVGLEAQRGRPHRDCGGRSRRRGGKTRAS